MNTPIERIQEIYREIIPKGMAAKDFNEHLLLYKIDKELGYEESDYSEGFLLAFRACEQEYQRLWQEFIESRDDKLTLSWNDTDKGYTEAIFFDFNEWLEDKQQ